LPVVLLSRMMSSRLFPAFCTQERQSWNTWESTTSDVHCTILCAKGGNNSKRRLFLPMILKLNTNLFVLFTVS
jgi:hypothetical protein